MPKATKLSEGGVKLLQEPQIAHFVTLMKSGAPQPTPVWVDVEADGSAVLINTSEGRVKAENTERDPRVAVSVVDKANSGRYVVVRGRVVERRHEGARENMDVLSKKYLNQDTYPYYQGEQRVILVIRPDHVLEQGT